MADPGRTVLIHPSLSAPAVAGKGSCWCLQALQHPLTIPQPTGPPWPHGSTCDSRTRAQIPWQSPALPWGTALCEPGREEPLAVPWGSRPGHICSPRADPAAGARGGGRERSRYSSRAAHTINGSGSKRLPEHLLRVPAGVSTGRLPQIIFQLIPPLGAAPGLVLAAPPRGLQWGGTAGGWYPPVPPHSPAG